MKSFFVSNARHLTEGERKLASQIFGDALILDEVKVIAHRLVLKHYAISPNGSIYFHPHDYRADFSLECLTLQAWLIHELTHVWQLQQGIAVVKEALFDRRYRYILQAGKCFWNYGIEQQAQMVQDYFLLSQRGQYCEELKQCIPFLSD